ncbi:putative uncharacterized protein [Burkholderiales bacterium GJ-E10]|nr:putative uncharacterized protein [Burkholderiales bacterium GJ-E10]
MSAELLIAERFALDDLSFVEMVVWQLEAPVAGCEHALKYRLAYVIEGRCVVRYDNEAGKGDHRHIGGREMQYTFRSLDALQIDFWSDVSEREARK